MQMVETAETSLRSEFGASPAASEACRDGIPTFWAHREQVHSILGFLKERAPGPYKMLYDLTAIDERTRTHRGSEPTGDFTVVYHLFSFERNEYIRLKTALDQDALSVDTITDLWPAANWYEREVWDMFGITFSTDTRISSAFSCRRPGKAIPCGKTIRRERPRWENSGFPTPSRMPSRRRFDSAPRNGAWREREEAVTFIFLNIGPQHPGTHGVLRVVLQLDGEEILDCVPEIGFHHRGAEKMGERQTWHTYIPYTDRIDYLGGVMNNLAYLTAVEKLSGIKVPARAQVIRVMLCRTVPDHQPSGLVRNLCAGSGPDVAGFYMFNDRERAFAIIEAICGARMHPNWFRIGGVAQDLPAAGTHVPRLPEYLPPRLAEYDRDIHAKPHLSRRARRVLDASPWMKQSTGA